jgi:predicted dehydrogenase
MARHYPNTRIIADATEAFADADVEAAAVAVEAPLHYELARAALEAGKHTYVEKPLCLTSQHAAHLVELAADANRKLMVGHLLEYHPAVNYIRDMIHSGQLGETLYLYSQRVNLGIVRENENAWWSLAPHDISIACYLFGDQPESVSACGWAYLRKDIEDVVFATLHFPDGRIAHIHVSWLDPHKIRKVTLVGSQRMVVFDDMAAGEKIRIYDKAAVVEPSVENYVGAITVRSGDIVIPKISAAEPLALECRHFVDSIHNDTTPLSDGPDGLRVVKVLEAGARSLEQDGMPVAVESDEMNERRGEQPQMETKR